MIFRLQIARLAQNAQVMLFRELRRVLVNFQACMEAIALYSASIQSIDSF